MDQSEKTPVTLPDEVSAAPENETPGEAQKPKKEKKAKKTDNLPSGKKKKKGGVGKVIRTILLILIALVLILALLIWKVPAVRNFAARYLPFLSVEKTDNGPDYLYHTVERHDIENVLTGTGTLQPNDSYTVTASVSGDILKADFEEMDEVAEDQVLFVIDSSDLEEDIADRQKDVADALEDYNDALADYDDLIITSDTTGTVRELYVEEGDRVNDGTRIAYVVDSDTMVLEIPFFAANTDLCRKGSEATVTFPSTGETLDGVVKSVGGVTSVNETGSTVRTVSIAVRNPGGITYGMRAYASFTGTDGVEYSSSADGSFVYNEEKTLTASSAGEIDSLMIEEGSIVHKNDRVAVLSSEALDNQVKQLKKSYDNLVDQLENLLDKREDYVITAPIAGTVVQKNYKELDTLGSNSMSSTTALAIIYDMSKLSFQMSIDELDLSLIEVGQTVKITSDSITDETFTGVITKKSIIGNSMSGTTTYPITVELDGNDRLLPGMNVNAEIVTSRAENVIAIPVSALKRGNTVDILKHEGGPDATMAGNFPDGKRGEQPDGGKRPGEENAFETVNVTTGISDDDYIEITSGLEEGDVVVYEDPTTYSTRTIDSMFSMFSSGSSGGMRGMSGTGGSASGGMPSGSPGGMSGGMSGGMPGGMR